MRPTRAPEAGLPARRACDGVLPSILIERPRKVEISDLLGAEIHDRGTPQLKFIS